MCDQPQLRRFAVALSLVGCLAVAPSCSGSDESGEADTAAVNDVGGVDSIAQQDVAATCEPDERGFCEACECDQQCAGDGARCVPLPSGERVCTHTCAVSKSAEECAPGTYCGLYGFTSGEFACLPAELTCEADGGQCSRCDAPEDCSEGYTCYESADTGAKDCYRTCADHTECDEGWACHDDDRVCVRVIGEKLVAACHTAQRLLCEPCGADFECAVGYSCVGDVCTEACTKGTGINSTCPEGLFCLGGFCQGSEGNPCQSWLTCGGANLCDSLEVCVKGLCRRTCEAGCNAFQVCTDGYCDEP